ncbi:MAG: (2Fe-2S)-binding protein [Christensenella sp.]|nr:(2Fe-2S)-binding protein [Christensenella sp.]
MRTKEIHVRINGQDYVRTVNVATTLAEFIRDDIGLTGTKIGCNEGECGACTVIFSGKPVNSCGVLAAEADHCEVLTIEGLSGEELHPLQQAFLDVGAVQCGFCTPGMIMNAKAILDRNPHPTEAYIRKNMEGNICRCTGYNRIIEAILLAAERMQ